MRLAVLGAGALGSALGQRLVYRGWDVCWGVRPGDEGRHSHLAAGLVYAVSEAVARAQVIVLALPAKAVPVVIGDGRAFASRVVLDFTTPATSDLSCTSPPAEGSVAEYIAARCPTALVAKVFTSMGAEVIADSNLDVRPQMFVAADRRATYEVAERLVEALGFEAVRAGRLRQARLLEAMGLLWLRLATVERRGRRIGLRVVSY